jgi:hypothetical protein
MAESGVTLKLNPRNVYRILMLPGVAGALSKYAEAVESNAESATSDGLGEIDSKPVISGKGYRKRHAVRVINSHPLAWVEEFGSYGGARSYALDSRGPHPGFVDSPRPSRMQRSTGRRTGVVGPNYSMVGAARGVIGYKPKKARSK